MPILRNFALLVILSGIIVITQSYYVGDQTIYSRTVEPSRIELHHAILKNEPFRGSWADNGANGVNIRILTIYAVEFANRATGMDILRLYKLLDMTAMFATFVLLLLYLTKWYSVEYGLIAILFLTALLPMTYAYHFFHPWDRLGALLWLLFAWAVRENRIIWCALIAFVGVLNKYDIIVLPGLYFLAHISRTNWKAVVQRTTLLILLSLGTYAALRVGIPDGFGPSDMAKIADHNIESLRQLNIAYPPFLAFSIPLILVVIGWRNADQFSRAGFALGLLILVGPLMLLSSFQEFRNQVGIMILMLPAVLAGLQTVLTAERRTAR